MRIVLNNIEYELIENNKDAFDYNEIKEKLEDVDYFDPFDYIFGDYSYDRLRLKGFYKKDNKNMNGINDFSNIRDYIENYCSYGCKYFILERIGNNNKK